MENKRICFVIPSLHGGGAERVVSVLADEFSKKGYKVEIINFCTSESEYCISKDIRRIVIGARGVVRIFFKAVRYLVENKYDAVIGFDIFCNLICSFRAVFWHKKCKIIISERNSPKEADISPILKALRFLLYPFADAIVFQTADAMNYYNYSRKILSKGTVIKNPVKQNLMSRSGIQNKEIIAMGRLEKQKNYDLLIDGAVAFHKEFPKYKFRIFGQGSLRDHLEKKIKDNNASKYIVMEGYCQNVHEQIVDSDIYVLTSCYEGMPNSLIEAMCMGFPVVSSDCPSGGPKDLVDNGVNGLLFENGNINDFVDKLKYLAGNTEKKEEMAERAKKIYDQVNVESVFREWEGVL